MLENLLNTKLKERLLGIFFAFPKRSFSTSELRIVTGAKNPLLVQALREFTRAQVLNMASRRHTRFFRINPYFRLYDELEDLVAESEEKAEDQVSKILKRIPNLKLAILSGIFTLEPQLPVDLLVVGEGINHLRLQKTLAEIEKLTGQEINYSVMNTEEYEYRQLMNDRFIRDILDYPHLVVFNTLK